VRYGVGRLITDQPDMSRIEEVSSASEATGELARWVDVAVIDYHLGDRDGLWLAQEIKQRPSPPGVLIYSAFADVELTVAAIVAGADGLLSKAALAEELPIAIRRLARGHQHFPAVPRLIATLLRSRLEPRNQAIFSMLVHGVAPAEICTRLRLAASELRSRRREIVQAIAPRPKRSTVPAAPLDYERTRRRRRYRNSG
jgi:DNA-binding NarL/FixJ family response regulator